jgi:hypothetical protein
MLRDLYGLGYGYHQIADLAHMTHDQMRTFLAAGIPERQCEYLLSLGEPADGTRESAFAAWWSGVAEVLPAGSEGVAHEAFCSGWEVAAL